MASKRKAGSSEDREVSRHRSHKMRRLSQSTSSPSSSSENEEDSKIKIVSDEDRDSDDDGPLDIESLPERVSIPSRAPEASLSKPKNIENIPHHRPSKMTDFAELGISPMLIRSLTTMSIRRPTPVQAACIPPLLSGQDCIGNAKTGSGKTIAFALPMLQKLSLDPYGIFGLILTPTRELAFQISEQFAVLGSSLNVRTSVVVGGMDMMTQALELNNRPHIVVATPGRLVDHMSNGTGEWTLNRVKFLVLDEADRLLSSTFASDLKIIFTALPSERQTGLFTATLTPSIEALVTAPPRPGKQTPVIYRDLSTVETVETLKQHYILVPSHVREVYLYHLICYPPESILHLRRDPPVTGKPKSKRKAPNGAADEADGPPKQPPPTIIFVRHPRTAAYLTTLLQHLEIRATALHSHLSQPARLASLQLFRASVVPVLVCTDVASRGLDMDDVGMVINWDMPSGKIKKRGKSIETPSDATDTNVEDDDVGGAEEYVHRVGRTARMGRGGVAVSFVTERTEDERMVQKIEQRIRTTLTELTLPEGKVLEQLNHVSTAKRTASMALQESDFGKRQQVHRIKRGKRVSP